MEGVHFKNNRLEQLVDQLYGLNRRLLTFEGKMLRMAERCVVDRQDFPAHYFGRELDPRWVRRVQRRAGKGWSRFDDAYGAEGEANPPGAPETAAENAPPLGPRT